MVQINRWRQFHGFTYLLPLRHESVRSLRLLQKAASPVAFEPNIRRAFITELLKFLLR
jgi:hypothetical protein